MGGESTVQGQGSGDGADEERTTGITEFRTVLDGAAIAEAGSRAMVLWPPSPPWDEEPGEPPGPRVPEGGWFDGVNRRGTD